MIFNSHRQSPVFNDNTSINSDDRTTFSPSSVDFERPEENTSSDKEEQADFGIFNSSLESTDLGKSNISDRSKNFSIENLIKK